MFRAALIALALLSAPLAAQEGQGGQQAAPVHRGAVLTIDTDRIFSESLFGRRVADEYRAATEELGAENRRIEAELTAEEQSLTDRRAAMDPEDFRAEAEAFDIRVQAIRSEQDAKERALQEHLTQGRDAFLSATTSILGELMQEAGASVILDRRSVFLALGAIDVTEDAIAAIDAAIGDGAEAGLAPAP